MEKIMSRLPTSDKPLFEILVPSFGSNEIFRPFLVKEEKILLLAQAGDEKDMVRALIQIINNCDVHHKINVNDLTTFDLEYIFLKLRSKSVNNIVKLQFQDVDDEQIYDFEINLDKVEMSFDPNHSSKIEITKNSGIIMKYPSVSLSTNFPETLHTPSDIMDYLIKNCIDVIYDKDDIYRCSEYTDEEIQEFIDNLDISVYDNIKEFFATMPKMSHTLEYTNKNGLDRKIVLSSLRDFFTWG
jgi:hypothetical protein